MTEENINKIRGFVHRVDEKLGEAYCSLRFWRTNEWKHFYDAVIPIALLKSAKIEECDSFFLENENGKPILKKIPFRPVSVEELREIDKLLGLDDFDD